MQVSISPQNQEIDKNFIDNFSLCVYMLTPILMKKKTFTVHKTLFYLDRTDSLIS